MFLSKLSSVLCLSANYNPGDNPHSRGGRLSTPPTVAVGVGRLLDLEARCVVRRRDREDMRPARRRVDTRDAVDPRGGRYIRTRDGGGRAGGCRYNGMVGEVWRQGESALFYVSL
jgi:hypothetical protein